VVIGCLLYYNAIGFMELYDRFLIPAIASFIFRLGQIFHFIAILAGKSGQVAAPKSKREAAGVEGERKPGAGARG